MEPLMMRILFTALLTLTLLTGCKRNPPADWSSPLGAASVTMESERFCTLLDSDEQSFDQTDIAGSKAIVRIINDRQIAGTIESIATKLIDDKKTTSASDLQEQLKRDTCKASLVNGQDQSLTSAQIYDQCSPSVLVFSGVYKCGKCAHWHAAPASGFVISEDGVAVTNFHVMEKGNNETFVAMTIDGKVYPVKEILAASKSFDLAIVQLDLPEGMKLKALPIAPTAAIGSAVTLISHPDRRFYTLTTGNVSRYDTASRAGATVPQITITADYARGSSGAPVLNDQGQVIAIVASTQSVYYSTEGGVQKNLQMVFKQCIPSENLLKMIESK